MDGSISTQQLYRRLGSALAPVLVDVRGATAFAADTAIRVGAGRRSPQSLRAL